MDGTAGCFQVTGIVPVDDIPEASALSHCDDRYLWCCRAKIDRGPRCFFRQRGARDIGEAQRTLFEEEWTVAEPMAAQRLPECALPIQVLGRDFEVALPAARASI